MPRHLERVLRSDYALTRAFDKDAWVGYRDTFEVDGRPVRDREDRLQRLLSSDAPASAARIASESARFNLGNSIVTRNVNVPTLVLEMLQPRNQDRGARRPAKSGLATCERGRSSSPKRSGRRSFATRTGAIGSRTDGCG
jgi:hypothetical protein